MQKTDKPGIYTQQPDPVPSNRRDLAPGGLIYIFKLREMDDADIDALDLRKYLRKEDAD